MEYLNWNRKKLITEIKNASFVMTMQVFTSETETQKYWKLYSDKDDVELNEKTTPQLQSIYFDIKKYDAEFKKEVQEHIEKNLFYNQESANADNEHWAKHPYWSIEEGITLTLGKDPRIVKWEEVKLHAHHSPFAKKYEERISIAMRYVKCEQLAMSSTPGTFLAWAQRMWNEIPLALIHAVEATGIQIADWQTLYQKAMEIVDQRNQTIAHLEKKIQEQDLLLQEQELKETERKSLYRLVSTMAYDGYKYKPKENKSPFHSEISQAATTYIGENIDEDTVRKWIRKATDKYPLKI